MPAVLSRAPRGFYAIVAHAFFMQTALAIVRPTTSYLALEMDVSVALLGLVVASFSLLPVFLAVWVGRRLDAGYETPVLLVSAACMLAAGAGLLWATPNLQMLLLWNAVLGLGHLGGILGEQAQLSAYDKAKLDRSFGLYTMTVAVGQALAPLFMGALGGDAVHPDTTLLLGAYLAGAVVVLATAFGMLRGRPPRRHGDRPAAATMREALAVEPRKRRVLTGSILFGMMVLCAMDLVQVYLPALAVERGISVGVVGMLLALRAAATVVSRFGLDRLVARFGRGRLLLVSSCGSAVLLALVAVPLPAAALGVLMFAIGLVMGVGQPLGMTLVSLYAEPGTRGTWIGLRMTGNRLGQAVIPATVGFFAVGLGTGGAFLCIGAAMGAVAASSFGAFRSLE